MHLHAKVRNHHCSWFFPLRHQLHVSEMHAHHCHVSETSWWCFFVINNSFSDQFDEFFIHTPMSCQCHYRIMQNFIYTICCFFIVLVAWMLIIFTFLSEQLVFRSVRWQLNVCETTWWPSIEFLLFISFISKFSHLPM